jgi:hypothetical protein
VSRNPFLDGTSTSILSQTPLASPDKMSFAADAMSPPRPILSGNAADLFVRHCVSVNLTPCVVTREAFNLILHIHLQLTRLQSFY